MDKISILMNCYNGEQYLNETLESVLCQSYTNWEIIFIDNCSTDRSAEIVKEKVKNLKYYKTKENINLGAARNFGVQKCGKYIAVLDTDDIWMPTALNVLYNAIKSGDFSVAYGNQFLIDKNGISIGKVSNLHKGSSGNFFNKLLMQFDIPITCTLIDKDKMFEMNLNFDKNIYGSEEYCLFLQMALKSNFIAVNDFLVKYRIHDSLTSRLNEKTHKDRNYTLNKIISENPGVTEDFKFGFQEAFARGTYYKVQFLVKNKQKKHALNEMRKIMFLDYRYFLTTLILLFPGYLPWKIFQNKKYKR
jgi:glycosyltransferase involved in cell wall biosynthesis